MVNIDTIHQSMLNNIDDSYQKTQGFPTYDLTRGIAIGVQELEEIAEETERKQDIDNITGDELDKFIEQRTGQTRTQAVNAKAILRVVNGSGTILLGDLFATETGIQFKAVETKFCNTNDTFEVECLTGGSVGNVPANSIILTPVVIQGITAITNDSNAHGGYDAETDDHFRNRYYELLRTPINGVNKNTYIIRAKEVDGVLGARCIPVWNGKNTVKVIVIGTDYKPADTVLIDKVQAYLDPNKNGDGSGTAPIGAVTTVIGATPVTVDIQITGLKIQTGHSEETVKQEIKDALDRYIKSTVFNTDYISVARTASVIMNVEGVLDYTNLKVNNAHKSITMGTEQCGVLGVITYD